MAKRKGFDVIEDAHELAQHNFHSSYWLNRVTSYTYATWMAEKKLSLIILPLLIIAWIPVISTLTSGVSNSNIWKVLFDFSSAESTYRFVAFIFLVFYTIINLIAAFQIIYAMIHKPIVQTVRKEEKKKKQPKRRKDYK